MLSRLPSCKACLLAIYCFLIASSPTSFSAPPGEPAHTNRLAKEKSPYLLQHAHNPVDWYPWGDEAFAKARAENKPVLLSIGYATCHWCHVMERESFENKATAQLMNTLFVCVKLDREERPDIDRIYMNFQQAIYGRGGWPLNVWLTPDRIPFASGTYFPPEPSHHSPSFTQVCQQIDSHWKKNEAKIQADPEGARAQLQKLLSGLGNDSPVADEFKISNALADVAYQQVTARFQPDPAGFANEPRFPQNDIIDFLLQHHLDASRPEEQRQSALSMARSTLHAMARGGIRDHLGGGFHRYAVDRYWHIPHFEKMLYDQAQIARSYLTLHQILGESAAAKIAREIFQYLDRDLSHPEGAFFSAEDADSYATTDSEHKTEGAFYTWTASGIEKVLGADEANLFFKAYGIRPEGNARPGSDPHGELGGQNHLYQHSLPEELAAFFDTREEDIISRLATAREKLLAARSHRIRPIRDGKIITAWNGLTISALAHAYRALGDVAYLTRANRAADFILTNLTHPSDGHLLRSYLDGPSDIPATAIDYAAMIAALIDLYEADFNPLRLTQAMDLQDMMLELLNDPKAGGFYDAAETQTDLIIRLKDLRDGALPSANSLAAVNLMRLYLLSGRKKYHDAASRIFQLALPLLESSPQALLRLLSAIDLDQNTPPQIIVATHELASSEARRLLLPAQRAPHANRVLALAAPDALPGKIAAYKALDDLPTLYLCQNFTCQAPVNEAEEIIQILNRTLAIPSGGGGGEVDE